MYLGGRGPNTGRRSRHGLEADRLHFPYSKNARRDTWCGVTTYVSATFAIRRIACRISMESDGHAAINAASIASCGDAQRQSERRECSAFAARYPWQKSQAQAVLSVPSISLTGSNPVAPTIVKIEPFGESVKGLSLLWDKTYAFERPVQTDDFEDSTLCSVVSDKPFGSQARNVLWNSSSLSLSRAITASI